MYQTWTARTETGRRCTMRVLGLGEIMRSEVIRRVLTEDALRVVYQPVMDLSTNKPFAYEALVRSTMDGYQNAMSLIDEAVNTGMMGELGRAIRQRAVDELPDSPLFLNINPTEFAEGWLVRPDDPIYQHEHPVYLEITESVPLSHFALVEEVLSEMRGKGLMLAVDDLGAGYSNLKYIADLEPEVVKLDRQLIIDLRPDTRLHKLVCGIVRLCHDLGAKVVAEGIETESELHAVRSTGADFAQGYYVARPANPKPEVRKFGLEPPNIH